MVAVFLGEMSRGRYISVRILMVILGDLSRGNSKYTTSSGALDSDGLYLDSQINQKGNVSVISPQQTPGLY